MDAINITLSVVAIISFLLTFVVFLRNPKNKVNFSLSLFILNATMWSIAILMFRTSHDALTALFWGKAIYIPGTLVPVTFLYFAYVLTRGKSVGYYASFILVPPAIYFYFLLSTPLWVSSAIQESYGWSLALGSFYIPWVIYFAIYMIWAAAVLIIKFSSSSGQLKMQLRYVLLASFIPLAGSIPFNFVYPYYGNFELIYLGPLSITLMIAIVSYAIVRHRFLDIRLVFARAVSYSLLILTLAGAYAGLLITASNTFIVPAGDQDLTVSVALALLVAVTFQPLKRVLEKVTDKIFFKDYYVPENILRRMSGVMTTKPDLERLTKGILGILLPSMHLSFGALLLLKEEKFGRAISSTNFNLGGVIFSKEQVNMFLEGEGSVVLFDDVEEGSLKELMRKNNVGGFVKLSVTDKNVGVLVLGEKLSGEMFTDNDVEVLEILGKQLAIGVLNALQYEEIKQFSTTLEGRVRQATSQLEGANTRLQGLDKQKDEFVSVVAHELRAPMTAIRGYLTMIMEGDAGKVPTRVSEFIQDALEGNDRMIRLVNNMLNVSRIEEGRMVYEMGVVGFGEVVKNVCEDFKTEAKRKGLQLTVVVEPNVKDNIYVDKDRIYEVVGNLVSNAVKYTDKGSVVMKLSQPRKDSVLLEVIDTGPGISAKEQEKLFKKFQRVDSSVGKTIGSGLGLYISRVLVEKFDGKMGVKSKPGNGSDFWVSLPLTTQKE